MKAALSCRLFGHKFFGKYAGTWVYGGGPTDYCGKCGLSKKELGITSDQK